MQWIQEDWKKFLGFWQFEFVWWMSRFSIWFQRCFSRFCGNPKNKGWEKACIRDLLIFFPTIVLIIPYYALIFGGCMGFPSFMMVVGILLMVSSMDFWGWNRVWGSKSMATGSWDFACPLEKQCIYFFKGFLNKIDNFHAISERGTLFQPPKILSKSSQNTHPEN